MSKTKSLRRWLSWFVGQDEGAKRRDRRCRPRLEGLEDRCTPATFTVNLNTDAADTNVGDGHADVDPNTPGDQTTLRAAIQEANATVDFDDIRFNFANPVTIELATALPDLSTNMDIEGPSATPIISVTRAVNAADFRIFTTTGQTACTLYGLDISGGSITLQGASGGGIANLGIYLQITSCYVHDNAVSSYGGGVFNGANLDIINSAIYSNRAGSWGGGVDSEGSNSSVELTNSQVFANYAGFYGGGIYLGSGTTLTSVNSQIYGNTAVLQGGGLDCTNSTVMFHGGSITANTSGNGGGFAGGGNQNGITATFDQGASISRNRATRNGGGGYVEAGTVTLLNCFLQDNTATLAAPGIGYLAGATVTLTNTQGQGMVQV